MNISNAEQASPAHTLHSHPPEVRVNDELIRLNDRTPTGSQVLAASGLRPDVEFALLLWPPVGPTREIGLEEGARTGDRSKPSRGRTSLQQGQEVAARRPGRADRMGSSGCSRARGAH